MCDIESYSYLPYLEGTGYVPKHRYSQGEEIREYVNLVAQKVVWDDDEKVWAVDLIQRCKGQAPETLQIRSRFVTIAAGVLNWPKLPNIPRILDCQGTCYILLVGGTMSLVDPPRTRHLPS